jgi:hypothetical protein
MEYSSTFSKDQLYYMQSFFFSASAHSGKQFMGTSKLIGSLYVLPLRLKLSVNMLAKMFLENKL